MRQLASQFFSELHSSTMKELGFKKARFRFTRERDGRIEVVEFQGSQWNDSSRPWRFYINLGVNFLDLPNSGRSSAAHQTHAYGRIEGIVSDSPEQFDLTDQNFEQLEVSISSLVKEALELLPSILPERTIVPNRG